jgi:hypothetical protein
MEARSSFPLSRASVIGDDGKLVANIYNTEETEALRIARQFATSGDMLDVLQRLIAGGESTLVLSLARAAVDRCGDTTTATQAEPARTGLQFLQSGLTKSERTILEVLREVDTIKTAQLIEATGLRGNSFYVAWRGLRDKRFVRSLVEKVGKEYTITDEGRNALDEAGESDRIRGLLEGE